MAGQASSTGSMSEFQAGRLRVGSDRWHDTKAQSANFGPNFGGSSTARIALRIDQANSVPSAPKSTEAQPWYARQAILKIGAPGSGAIDSDKRPTAIPTPAFSPVKVPLYHKWREPSKEIVVREAQRFDRFVVPAPLPDAERITADQRGTSYKLFPDRYADDGAGGYTGKYPRRVADKVVGGQIRSQWKGIVCREGAGYEERGKPVPVNERWKLEASSDTLQRSAADALRRKSFALHLQRHRGF